MTKFDQMSPDELENHLSNFLMPHWSVSAARTFVRNEKAFERQYIFKDYGSGRKGVSAIAGQVYAFVLRKFFEEYKLTGQTLGFDPLMEIAFDELDQVRPNQYKLSEKSSVEELKMEAQENINKLVTNFLGEVSLYLDDIQEILFIEEHTTAFITLNGVEIPLPVKIIPDIIYINKKGELVGLDHKSKGKYTTAAEAPLKHSYQSITYCKAIDARLARPEFAALRKKYPKIAEGMKYFKFYENKYSKNKDGSQQVKPFTIDIQEATLYESMLFETVWKMLQAVQDPDFIYSMNTDDNFEDAGEIVDFWVKTHMQDLDAFPALDQAQRKILSKRKVLIKKTAISKIPKSLIDALKGDKNFVSFDPSFMADKPIAEQIAYRLRCFNLNVIIPHMVEGYSCDTYLAEVGVGTQIAKVKNYALDIASVIGVENVRISDSLVKYEGKTYLSIEVERNEKKSLPLTKEVFKGLGEFELPIGMDNFGKLVTWDTSSGATAHLMISGAAGSGKSYAITSMILAGLKKGFDVVILDPKYEFGAFADKCTVLNELDQIEEFIAEQVQLMDKIFAAKGAKGNSSNKKIIFFDEVADCLSRQTKERRTQVEVGEYASGQQKTQLMKDQTFKTLEENLLILAQKSRSAGIHLVLAAQRFSAKILTGDVKANFTTRLALTAAKKVDSMVMIDEAGAESLSGAGDGLLVSPKLKITTRIQCFNPEAML